MFDKYVIKVGEDLGIISKKFKTSPNFLKDINNSPLSDLRAGMEIIVPDNSKMYFEFYTIESGDSLYGIARRYNINPSLLASLNGLNMEDYIYPNQEILIPKSNFSYYVTAEGDTLGSVSNAFQTTKDKLLEENTTVYLLPGQLMVHKK